MLDNRSVQFSLFPVSLFPRPPIRRQARGFIVNRFPELSGYLLVSEANERVYPSLSDRLYGDASVSPAVSRCSMHAFYASLTRKSEQQGCRGLFRKMGWRFETFKTTCLDWNISQQKLFSYILPCARVRLLRSRQLFV